MIITLPLDILTIGGVMRRASPEVAVFHLLAVATTLLPAPPLPSPARLLQCTS